MGLTALVVIFVSILLVVIFTDLPGFFGVLTALEMILEPLIFGVGDRVPSEPDRALRRQPPAAAAGTEDKVEALRSSAI